MNNFKNPPHRGIFLLLSSFSLQVQMITLDNPRLLYTKKMKITLSYNTDTMAKLTTRAQDYSERYNQLA